RRMDQDRAGDGGGSGEGAVREPEYGRQAADREVGSHRGAAEVPVWDFGSRMRCYEAAFAGCGCRRASATLPRRVCPTLPPQRGAFANNVANTRCTTSTAPTKAWKRRPPLTLPSSAPQKILKRALTRSTAVRPRYSRSNSLVARGMGGKRLRSSPQGRRACS